MPVPVLLLTVTGDGGETLSDAHDTPMLRRTGELNYGTFTLLGIK